MNLTAVATKDQASNPETSRQSNSVRGEIISLDLKELRAENNRAAGRSQQNGERRIGLVGPMSNYAAPPGWSPTSVTEASTKCPLSRGGGARNIAASGLPFPSYPASACS